VYCARETCTMGEGQGILMLAVSQERSTRTRED
jgi:hypothetical protein